LEASSLISQMPCVLEMQAREPQKLFSYSSDVVEFVATSHGESLVMLLCFGKQNLPGNEKVFSSINDFLAGDLQAPELLGW